MATNAEDSFNLEKFARDVIVHQLGLNGCNTSKITWPSLPENRYRWPDYIQSVSRTVSVLRLSQREEYIKWFSNYYSGKAALLASTLRRALSEISNPKMEELKHYDRCNIASLHTMFLLALYAGAALVSYRKEKYDLINEIPKWWQESYENNILVHLKAEGGLDMLKRWGDHIAYIDQDVTAEYIKSVNLPDNKYNLEKSDFEVLIKKAKSNFTPDLDNVHIYYDGTLRFLDIMPFPPNSRERRYCFGTAKVKTEHSDLFVRLGFISVETLNTPEKIFPPTPLKKVLISADSVMASSIETARKALKFSYNRPWE